MNAEQYNNTKKLLDIITYKIEKNESPEVLDDWIQPCGTYGCILGDYLLQIYHEAYQNISLPHKREFITRMCRYFDFKEEFGFSELTRVESDVETSCCLNIIGDHTEGSLGQRLDYVLFKLREYEDAA